MSVTLLGLVGLAISYVLSATGLLNGVVTYFTETEKQMVSVERVNQYIDSIPQESEEFSLYVSADILCCRLRFVLSHASSESSVLLKIRCWQRRSF
jgi:hypothetical protein